MKSRIRTAENLLLAQLYSPHLFRQGPPLGPYYLRKVLAREENENGERMTKAVALRAWRQKDKQLEAEKETNDASDKWSESMTLPCRHCTRGDSGNWLPLTAFTRASSYDEIWRTTLAKGQDLTCYRCMHLLGWTRIDTPAIMCDTCLTIKIVQAYPLEVQERWKKLSSERIECSKCAGLEEARGRRPRPTQE